MAVHRLNHVVLYVRDVTISRAFYQEVFGFREVGGSEGRSSFLQAPDSNNDHDLGLFAIGADAGHSGAGRESVGMYHVAWELSTLGELREIRDELNRRGHLVGATNHGTTKAIYGVDPDGLEFEVCWIVPVSLLTPDAIADRPKLQPLHLDAEIERYGIDTRGGLGISIPLDMHA